MTYTDMLSELLPWCALSRIVFLMLHCRYLPGYLLLTTTYYIQDQIEHVSTMYQTTYSSTMNPRYLRACHLSQTQMSNFILHCLLVSSVFLRWSENKHCLVANLLAGSSAGMVSCQQRGGLLLPRYDVRAEPVCIQTPRFQKHVCSWPHGPIAWDLILQRESTWQFALIGTVCLL